jgi:hypothetical protein
MADCKSKKGFGNNNNMNEGPPFFIFHIPKIIKLI